MILHDPLCACLLDLSARLGGDYPLVVGGGYGLYLKQRMLLNQGTRTRFPQAQLPENRTTQDIDLILHADIVVSAERMKSLRDALDSLGCSVIKGSEYLQFTRPAAPAGEVKIDVLVGPLGDRFDPVTMKRDDRRVRAHDTAGGRGHTGIGRSSPQQSEGAGSPPGRRGLLRAP